MPKPATIIDPKVKPNPALEKRTRRVFTTDYKLSILRQADDCQHGELGKLLRREKLYSNQLAQWRREFAEHGVAGLEKSSPGPTPKKSAEAVLQNFTAAAAVLPIPTIVTERSTTSTSLAVSFRKSAWNARL